MRVYFLSSHPYCRTLAAAAHDDGVDAVVFEGPNGLESAEQPDVLVVDEAFLTSDFRSELPRFGLPEDLPLVVFLQAPEISRALQQTLLAASVTGLFTAETAPDEVVPRVQLATSRQSSRLYEHTIHLTKELSDQRNAAKQLAQSLQLQTGISEVSRALMHFNRESEALCASAIAAAFGADRVTIAWLFANESEQITQHTTSDMTATRFHPCIEAEHFPWYFAKLNDEKLLHIDRLEEIHEMAAAEHQFFKGCGTQAFLSAAIIDRDGDMLGSLCVEKKNSKQPWSSSQRAALTLLAGLFSAAWQERASRRSRELQSKLIDQINDGIFVLDTRGMITSWNRGAMLVFGYSDSEAIGQHISLLFDKQQHAKLFDTLIRPILNNPTFEYEAKCRTREDQEIDALFSLALLRDKLGKPSGVICYTIDISQRKRAEENLRLSEARLSSVVGALRDAIVTCDSDGSVLSAMAASAELFKTTPDELVGADLSSLFVRSDASKLREAILKHATLGQRHAIDHVHKATVQVSSGKRIPCEVFIAYGVALGEPFYTLSIRDVSQQREAERRLAQGQRMQMLGSLAAGVSNELNNIFGPISAYAELLQLAPLEKRYLESVGHILSCTTRARTLIDQVLTFSRRAETNVEGLPVTEFMAGTSQLLRAAFGVTPTLNAESMPRLQIERAFASSIQELIVRIAQAVGESTAGRYGAQIELSAKLSSIDGLSAVEVKLLIRPTIDDPMERALLHSRSALSESDEAMLSEQAKMLLCDLTFYRAEAEGDNLGFAISMPASEIVEVEAPADGNTRRLQDADAMHRTTRRISDSGGVRVMVVDDDEMVAESLCDLAASLGYETECFFRPREALARLRGAPREFSLVITDLSMPDIKGDALTKAIGELEIEIGVVVATGLRDLLPPETSEISVFRECIQKPITLDALRELLFRHVGVPHIKGA